MKTLPTWNLNGALHHKEYLVQPLQVITRTYDYIQDLLSSVCCWINISPSLCRLGGRPPGNEAFSWANGRVLRPLGGLRLGEGGPSQCLNWAPARIGEGAHGASVGACVLGEALTCLTELNLFGLDQWTTCVCGGQIKLQEAFCMLRVIRCLLPY